VSGYRVLVDRVWPRGVSKESLELDEWAKELAPSTELRKWFHHDPERWDEFRSRYFQELVAQNDVVTGLLDRCSQQSLVLYFGARDIEHNNAVALRDYLCNHFAGLHSTHDS